MRWLKRFVKKYGVYFGLILLWKEYNRRRKKNRRR